MVASVRFSGAQHCSPWDRIPGGTVDRLAGKRRGADRCFGCPSQPRSGVNDRGVEREYPPAGATLPLIRAVTHVTSAILDAEGRRHRRSVFDVRCRLTARPRMSCRWRSVFGTHAPCDLQTTIR